LITIRKFTKNTNNGKKHDELIKQFSYDKHLLIKDMMGLVRPNQLCIFPGQAIANAFFI